MASSGPGAWAGRADPRGGPGDDTMSPVVAGIRFVGDLAAATRMRSGPPASGRLLPAATSRWRGGRFTESSPLLAAGRPARIWQVAGRPGGAPNPGAPASATSTVD